MSRSLSFRGSLMIPITTLCIVCRKTDLDIAGKTKFITGKKLKRESPVYHNKTKNLKHLCFNVVSEKPIHQLSNFCLIQGINNYVQINTYLLEIYSTNYGK